MQDFVDPESVFEKINLREGMIAADFGCGAGSWAIPLARILEEGKVYAIDVLDEPLSVLRSRMKSAKVQNIEIIKADVEKNSKLLSNSCDLVLITNLLFEVESIKNVLLEAKRVLRGGGEILIVDWKKEAPFGPQKRVSLEEIREIASQLGLEEKKEFPAGKYHFVLLLSK